MAHGDPQLSPWVSEFLDNHSLLLSITVNYNDTTKALTSAVVHRDSGCLFTKVVFDNPSDGVKSKRLAAPADGAGDRTYTAAQLASQGMNTITQAMAVQITAEP
jgi:hypothetical protein